MDNRNANANGPAAAVNMLVTSAVRVAVAECNGKARAPHVSEARALVLARANTNASAHGIATAFHCYHSVARACLNAVARARGDGVASAGDGQGRGLACLNLVTSAGRHLLARAYGVTGAPTVRPHAARDRRRSEFFASHVKLHGGLDVSNNGRLLPRLRIGRLRRMIGGDTVRFSHGNRSPWPSRAREMQSQPSGSLCATR
jgi:hypothetical protein